MKIPGSIAFCFLFITINCLAYGQDFWQQTGGPYGGQTFAIAFTPDGSILASTRNGGSGRTSLYKSTDDGNSWYCIEDRLEYSNYIRCFAVDADGYIYGGSNGGTVYSTDNGETWSFPGNQGFMAGEVYVLTVDENNILYAGTDSKIFYSTDRGQSWDEIDGAYEINTLYITSSGYSYAGSYMLGVYRSTDGGSSWTQANNGLPSGVDVRSIAVAPNYDVFAGTNGYGVYRSTNNGATWVQVNTGITNNFIKYIGAEDNGYLFASTGNSLFRSTDNGNSWSALTNGLPPVAGNCIEINSDNSIFLGTTYGVYFSNNQGDQWTKGSTGMRALMVKALGIDSRGTLWAGSYTNGLFFSDNGGDSWERVEKLIPLISSVMIDSDDDIFVFAEDSVYRSSDYGGSWTTSKMGIYNSEWIRPVQNSEGDIFAGKLGEGVFRSTDKGASWTNVSNGLTSLHVHSVLAAANGYLFAATFEGLFRSTDDGAEWTKLTNGLTDTEFWALASNSQGEIFTAGYSYQLFSHILKSTDNGDSWTAVGYISGYPNLICMTVNSLDYLFAGTLLYGGAYYSSDSGDNWSKIADGFPSYTSALTLVVDPDDYIYAGTESSVFKSVKSTTGVNYHQSDALSGYRLLQNFPNPFNPATTISFSLSKTSYISLRVYDILGNECAVLADGEKVSGMYDVQFSGDRLAAGIYFYRLEARAVEDNDHFSKTGKMILLK